MEEFLKQYQCCNKIRSNLHLASKACDKKANPILGHTSKKQGHTVIGKSKPDLHLNFVVRSQPLNESMNDRTFCFSLNLC